VEDKEKRKILSHRSLTRAYWFD